MTVSVFFPLRAGSTRVNRKNTRKFTPRGQSLFELKLSQIKRIADRFLEVIVSTNDASVIEQFAVHREAHPGVCIVERPEHLCLSTTPVEELIDYAPTVCSGDWILWLHATSPYIDERWFETALEFTEDEGKLSRHDSAMTVNPIQQFLWSETKKNIINADRRKNPWPNTQDLDPLFEINHGLYIFRRSGYIESRDRIGKTPYLIKCKGLQAIDIDWPDDFKIAQTLFGLYETTARHEV